MSNADGGRRAARRTYLLSVSLLVVCAVVLVADSTPSVVSTSLSTGSTTALLLVVFLLAEQLMLNVEFRRQAHSLTLASIPLVLGVLVVPARELVLARVVGAGIALLIQRVSATKLLYNCSAYAFEAAIDTAIVHAVLGDSRQLSLGGAAVVLGVVVAVDQLMSTLVLVVIMIHGGSMTGPDVREVLLPSFCMTMVSTAMAIGLLLMLEVGALGIAVLTVLLFIAVVLYRNYLSITRRHHRLELIHEFVTGDGGVQSLDAVASDLLRRIRTLLRATTAELMVVSEDGSVVVRVDDDSTGYAVTRGAAALHPALQQVIDDRRPLLAVRSTKSRSAPDWLRERGNRDAVAVPLPDTSGLRGLLLVSDRLGETTSFTPYDVSMLQTLTGHFAVAGRNAQLVERLAYEATHDALTGLANRVLLARRLADRADDSRACIVLMNLDRFREVNDGLGHEVGDQLLCTLAARLRDAVPAGATAARLGADEFAVLVPDFSGDEEQAHALAADLAAVLGQPIAVEGVALSTDASVGIALSDPDRPDADLLREADIAMYVAKDSGGRVAVYRREMERGRLESLGLLADLRTVLRESPEQIAVYYQPKIDLASRAVVSAEALVRWLHPTLGIVGPDRFIPLAETTGLIDQFTPLVLRAALTECARWRRAGHILKVAVNLSARNIGDPSLPDRVMDSLAEAGVPAEQLILEITESSIIADPQQTMEVLRRLSGLGVTISLDDFGTGYSSLSYLQQLPVQEVKIDRSFVVALTSDDPRPGRVLISSIAGLAHNLGLSVVAEGAETEEVLDELALLGCTIAQGYVISRPLPADSFLDWLHAQPARATFTSHLVRN